MVTNKQIIDKHNAHRIHTFYVYIIIHNDYNYVKLCTFIIHIIQIFHEVYIL